MIYLNFILLNSSLKTKNAMNEVSFTKYVYLHTIKVRLWHRNTYILEYLQFSLKTLYWSKKVKL